MRQYYVYIMASLSRTLYVGVTNDLRFRVYQHRAGKSDFTRRYRVNRLVYFECTEDVITAISREKQIKAWRRSKRVELIECSNAGWRDLSVDW